MTRRSIRNLLLAATLGLACVGTAVGRERVDQSLPAFTASSASGAVKMAVVGAARGPAIGLASALKTEGSNVTASASGDASAFASGASDVAIVSGTMAERDISAFRSKFGYAPTAITLGADAVAVYVNKDNPVSGLTFEQIDSAFSSSRKRGGSAASTWGDLGAGGAWATKTIKISGDNPSSAASAMFKDVVLQGAELKQGIEVETGPSAVANAVGVDASGIGFASVGYATKRAKVVPIAAQGSNFVAPSTEACLNGSYPLSRPVTMYIKRKPGEPLAAPVAELVNLALSREGQEALAVEGLVTLTASAASRERQNIK